MSYPGPCIMCGALNYPASMGGPDLCPMCDTGYSSNPKYLGQLNSDNIKLRKVIEDSGFFPTVGQIDKAILEFVNDESNGFINEIAKVEFSKHKSIKLSQAIHDILWRDLGKR